MVKFRMKVLVTLGLIIALLSLNTGFTSFASETELALNVVADQKEIDNVLKKLSQNKGFNDFSDLNHGQLQKHFVGMALVPEKDVYVIGFEQVEKKKNQDQTGWSLTVVFDFNNNELIDATFGVVTDDTIMINNKVKNKKETRTKDQYEKDLAAFNKEDCGCGVAVSDDANKSGIAAVVDDLLSTPKAAAMSESLKCGWSSVVMCSIWGVITGGWGGFICSATMMYMCSYVPLSS